MAGIDTVGDGVETDYFVCTLGQAAALHKSPPHEYETISDFLDRQARIYPARPAVGFPVPAKLTGETWGHAIYTFEDLRRTSISLGRRLWEHGSPLSESEKTVALLCPSSLAFLTHWLALMRMGYSTLLIAPQCQPSAIRHLCMECKVSKLYFDSTYADLAKDACQGQESCIPMQRLLDIGSHRNDAGDTAAHAYSDGDGKRLWLISKSDIAYLHHTSGTSSGLPKPIPQTHHAAVGVLPTLDHGHDKATFTTTPLYHGGVADCFRAWTSSAMIWLFPGADVPITAANVLASLHCTQTATLKDKTPKVKYFSSVPYILQIMAAEHDGLAMLKEMELVGVGGAALPPQAGDDLVAQGINLLSRFGSAECGFLMSSHRDYATDKEWQYLRSRGSSLLEFEIQEDGLSELVVRPTWPHMAKRNREDGSYATADLFEPHPTIPDAWKYHSRSDSQLTLITGKKFDPAPLEAVIATSSLLSDVLIFGNGRQYPGALVFCSSNSVEMPSEDLLEALWPSIQRLNVESQAHTRLSKSMLIAMPRNAPGLEKSSKGTVMRGQAEQRYASSINAAYDASTITPAHENNIKGSHVEVSDEEVPTTILQIVKGVIDNVDTIPGHADLFSFGVDSVACMQIRALLQRELLPGNSTQLPLNVVYDCGTIHQLSKYLISARKGRSVDEIDEIQMMRDLVKEYSIIQDMRTETSSISGNEVSEPKVTGEVVILTGATGTLGAHILALLRDSPKVSQIHCLVRAATEYAAHERVFKSLRARRREAQSPSEDLSRKISCHPCKLSEPLLGLPKGLYRSLADRVTIIVHAAWAVNFSMRLPSFIKDHISGLRNLFAFALSSSNIASPRFVSCSSTASVLGQHAGSVISGARPDFTSVLQAANAKVFGNQSTTQLSQQYKSARAVDDAFYNAVDWDQVSLLEQQTTSAIPEAISSDPRAASSLGYSRSKWVAEAICDAANQYSGLRGNIAVLRIGQLCGDTRYGIWNKSEAWPLMLSSVKVTGCLPNLKESLDWLPVDIAAEAVLEVALVEKLCHPQENKSKTPVYHILNPSTQTTWSDLLRWMHKLMPDFHIIAPAEWVTKLTNLEGEAANNPARKLIGLWREAYCKDSEESEKKEDVRFAMEQTKKIAPSMRDIQPVDEKLFRKLWSWIDHIDSDASSN